jgi:hypothetical protein
MTKTNKCPYSKNVVCEYMDVEAQEYPPCHDCPHYFPKPHMDDPVDGRKTIGCLLAGIAILSGLLALTGWIIHTLRP